MKKRRFLALFLAGVVATPCVFGLSLSVQVVQNVGDEEEPSLISSLIEQSVIDYFFESGHIVSSSPVYVLSTDDKNKKALKAALRDTQDGGLDYLVTITVDYAVEKELKKSAALLLQYIQSASWKVYAASTGKELASGSGRPSAISNANNNEKGIIKFSSQLASQINAGLQKNR